MGLDSSIYSFSRQIRRLKLDLVYEYVAQTMIMTDENER